MDAIMHVRELAQSWAKGRGVRFLETFAFTFKRAFSFDEQGGDYMDNVHISGMYDIAFFELS